MANRARVLVDKLNLRPAPGMDNTPLVELRRGTEVVILVEVPRWYEVMTPLGHGYVSSNPTLVGRRHTVAEDLVTVTLPVTGKTVMLHPEAAVAFQAVLNSLNGPDLAAVCRVSSSFRSWASQEALVRKYEEAIGESWKSWRDLTPLQVAKAEGAGFAYHPGTPPVDAPHTHVGGGALDIHEGLSLIAVAALEAHGFRLDTKGDDVHWAWYGH